MMIIALAALSFSLAYTIFAAARLILFRRRKSKTAASPPATIAKPLCGLEADLEENLRSFCQQDYPAYEVIFAVASEDDPAAAVARRVMRSGIDALVIAPPGATNQKVNSLIAIERRAKHPILVVADSDIRVQRDYLRTIVAPFADATVGGVTAVYA